MAKYIYYLEDSDGCAVYHMKKTDLGKTASLFSGPILLEFQSAKDARIYRDSHFQDEHLAVKSRLRSAVKGGAQC